MEIVGMVETAEIVGTVETVKMVEISHTFHKFY